MDVLVEVGGCLEGVLVSNVFLSWVCAWWACRSQACLGCVVGLWGYAPVASSSPPKCICEGVLVASLASRLPFDVLRWWLWVWSSKPKARVRTLMACLISVSEGVSSVLVLVLVSVSVSGLHLLLS